MEKREYEDWKSKVMAANKESESEGNDISFLSLFFEDGIILIDKNPWIHSADSSRRKKQSRLNFSRKPSQTSTFQE